MITKTIKTPFRIQLFFIAFVVIMMTPFFAYIASASPLDDYCERQFNISFMQKLHPVAKKCESRFKIITDQWVGFKINK